MANDAALIRLRTVTVIPIHGYPPHSLHALYLFFHIPTVNWSKYMPLGHVA
jgi:hypothetical protein